MNQKQILKNISKDIHDKIYIECVKRGSKYIIHCQYSVVLSVYRCLSNYRKIELKDNKVYLGYSKEEI